jgi:hypothetical protein
MELTDKEKEVLLNMLGRMNQYETKAILCKTYDEKDLESCCTTLVNIYLKLNREINK